MNPAFGEQPAFFIDEGHFIPIRIVVHGNAIVVLKIAGLLDHWIEWSRHGGRGTTSKGAFVLEQHPTRPAVRMPDVAYTPRDDDRNLDREQVWTYRGEPFAPSFVVEIDKLSGEGSQRDALDRKMRNEYFQHGVRLGWLIDPHPEGHMMYEYYLDKHGRVQCSSDSAWSYLDGGEVLPDSLSSAPIWTWCLTRIRGRRRKRKLTFLAQSEDAANDSEHVVHGDLMLNGTAKSVLCRSFWPSRSRSHRC